MAYHVRQLDTVANRKRQGRNGSLLARSHPVVTGSGGRQQRFRVATGVGWRACCPNAVAPVTVPGRVAVYLPDYRIALRVDSVVQVSVPEPGSWLLLLSGGLLIVWRRVGFAFRAE